MFDPKKIYLVKTEPIGEELEKYTFPVIFRVLDASGVSEDITYNTAGERSVLKDTNTFTPGEKTKLESLNIQNATLSMSNNATLSMANSNVSFNSSANFNMGSATFSMTSGGKFTLTNSGVIKIDGGYKLTLGDNASVPEKLDSGMLILAGSAGILAENVKSENGKVVITSGSNAKLEINNDNFVIGGAQSIKYDSSGIKLGYNMSSKTHTFSYPITALADTVLVYQNGTDPEWVKKDILFESMTPNALVSIINKPENDALISELKTLLGLNQA